MVLFCLWRHHIGCACISMCQRCYRWSTTRKSLSTSSRCLWISRLRLYVMLGRPILKCFNDIARLCQCDFEIRVHFGEVMYLMVIERSNLLPNSTRAWVTVSFRPSCLFLFSVLRLEPPMRLSSPNHWLSAAVHIDLVTRSSAWLLSLVLGSYQSLCLQCCPPLMDLKGWT